MATAKRLSAWSNLIRSPCGQVGPTRGHGFAGQSLLCEARPRDVTRNRPKRIKPASAVPTRELRWNQSDRPAPAGAGCFNAHRQTRYEETVRAANLVQVGELFDLAVFASQAGEVGRPNVATVTRATEVGYHVGEGPIERVGVDADHADSLLDKPQHAFASQTGLAEIIGRAEAGVGARLQEHDVERLKRVFDVPERRRQVINRDG